MSGTSSVPEPTFGDNGFVAPTESEILTGVQADTNAAFGGRLNPALETPQGQLASSITAVIGDKNNQFLALANGVDPAYAAGRMQDAIGRIYFIERNPAQSTTVQATCSGLVGTTIPVGALAVATDGNYYQCVQAGTIPAAGNVTLTFACIATGPIACPATSLNTIYRTISGWDSINNPADGVLGSVVESRADFEFRRFNSVAQNSVGTLPAIIGSVLNVDGVLDAYVTDNYTGAPLTIGGVTLAANTLYVCVSGGAALDVATAIWKKKNPGCGYTGDTTVVVTDSNSGYSPPLPTYSVKFQTAAALVVFFTVSIANSAQVPSNAWVQIQNAILNAFVGGDGGPRARIGATIFASRFYAGVASLGTWAQIVSIVIGSTNTPTAEITADIAATTLTISATASGTVAIGQAVVGAGIADGTYITAGSGSSWTVSISQTVSSETMYCVAPSLNDITVDIDQAPTTTASDIVLTLV